PADHLIGNQPPGANLPPAADPTEKPALNPTVAQTGAPAVGPAEDRSAKTPVGPTPGATTGRPAGARGKQSGWWIALASLGGLALLAVCGLGAAWLLDWLPWPAPGPTSIPTQAAVAAITQSSLPPATATLEPTLAVPTASPTPRPTTRPTNTTPPTVDPRIPPPCSAIGQTWTSPADGMTLVCVPAGEFLMGSLGDDANADADEKPQHPVTLDAYWIDQTEVTNAMFAAFVAATGYQTQAEVEGWGTITVTKDGWGNIAGVTWQRPTGYGSGIIGLEDHPVVQVSWNDAQAYCEWAGRQLPSEAQWEKAARGTDARVYPWGNQLPDTTFLNFYANMGGTTTVGRYPKGASPYGALDLAGNVWEWTADWYGEPYYASPAAGTNPTGPESGKYRLIRGGSWKNATWYVRTASRIGFSPNTRVEILGFRCALNPAP
ncbi:MAG TPA: SUMF1/EgtB/PvdO family nonheme iron enzyme, partial [Anaerolineaceae bacterium]|nr:SUMF1/EgtB/PvdO family nonheme iron enzyme [Anaerolineaceae bacterium]